MPAERPQERRTFPLALPPRQRHGLYRLCELPMRVQDAPASSFSPGDVWLSVAKPAVLIPRRRLLYRALRLHSEWMCSFPPPRIGEPLSACTEESVGLLRVEI